MTRWWEIEPVRFECEKGCTNCCAKPGWVYFDKEDLTNAAEYLDIKVGEFKKQFQLEPMGYGHWEMGVTENEPCPFLGKQGCSIHEVKPKQCRAFPFWEENLRTRKDWKKTGEHCPGIGEGPAWSPDLIRQNKDTVWP